MATEITTTKLPKEALKKSGVKQVELAERLNLTQPTISGILSRRRIGADVLISMLNAIGYTVMVGEKHGEEFEPLWEIVNGDE